MPQTLEIPPAQSAQADPIDMLLERILNRENLPRDPNARGKAGEMGLFQIMPQTGAMYGATPTDLLDPVKNRAVAKRYMQDLIRRYQGNVPLAIAAYNAGPGNVDKHNIPSSTQSYVRKVLEEMGGGVSKLMGEGTASAADIPPGASIGSPIPAGASIGTTSKSTPIPKGATVGSGAAKTKDPLAVRAAGFLPMVGQFGGEALGAMGGAAIPGADLSGVPEYAGAVAGGSAGSAGGAALENKVRAHYGLPPVSVGSEAAWGGAGSAVGGLIPFVGRFRKAAAVARATGLSFKDALEKVMQSEAQLEGTLGMGARKAKMLTDAPSTQLQGAYRTAQQTGLDQLGQGYQTLLKPFINKLTPNTAEKVMNGRAGKMLELTGKPLRQAVEDEFAKRPMTVRRAQVILSQLRSMRRSMNPETQRMALSAIGDIENALKTDIRSVVGQGVSQQLDALDYQYARQIGRFPQRAVRGAFTEPQAAEAILSSKAGDSGRVLEAIREMKSTGQIAPLQRGLATRIFQKAGDAATTPGERLAALSKAVGSIKPEVFDELYGKGAQKTWLSAADAIQTRHADLLKNPDQAAAVATEVGNYLKAPGMIARFKHYLGDRLLFDALILGGGYETGHLAEAGAALIGIEGYEMVAHSPIAMRMLARAATEKDPKLAARLIVAALGTSVRTVAESQLGGTPDAAHR
jgi:hypothetical protein